LTTFERRLSRLGGSVPILVIRLPDLERVAWRNGRHAARTLERRAISAFATAVSRVLRGDDVVAHDVGSDVFVAALVAPTRDGVSVRAPVDARSALARIAGTMESTTQLDCATGWTLYDPASDAGKFEAVVERGLVRGAQERERYAFFSALGHELRTPLASIRGYLETLLVDDVDERTRRRFIGIAHNESLRLSRLVDGMFEISLLDLHATFPARACGSLERALAAAHDACAARAAAKGVSISVATGAAVAVAVAVDDDRLTLVLINLIDNAVKHGRPDGTVRIMLDLDDARYARLTIDDDGPGIPPADRDRVFGIGTRGATDADGNGIGLALVRLIVERIGGRVEVDGSPAGGARFIVTIPRLAEPSGRN
jgi:signal transduction histidine kinase